MSENTTAKKTNSTAISVIAFLALYVVSEFKIIMGELSVTFWLDNFLPIDATPITTLCKVGYIIAGAVAFTKVIRGIIDKTKPATNRANTLLQLLHNAVSYISVIGGLILGLVALDVDVVGIATTVGILGIIVGFGAESLIADVFTGICMIFENQYNVGDVIEVNGFRGTVTQIGIRTTSVKDIGENVKIFNNSQIKNVLNCSSNTSVAVCDFSISYTKNLKDAERVLEDTIKAVKEKNSDVFENIKYVGVDALGKSTITLRVIAYTNENDIFKAKRILNREVYMAFVEKNIELAK